MTQGSLTASSFLAVSTTSNRRFNKLKLKMKLKMTTSNHLPKRRSRGPSITPWLAAVGSVYFLDEM